MAPRKVQQASSSSRAAQAIIKGGSAGGFGGFSGSTALPSVPGFGFGASSLRGAATAATAGAGDDSSATAQTSAAGRLGGCGGGDGGEPTLSPQLDGDMAQLLRHLSKRDATTKLKALQALGARIRERAAASPAGPDMSAVLPPWVYMYRRHLVADGSRAVRTEAAVVLGVLSAAVGKAIAPHLKALMGPWWLAQCDTYTEAATAARSAFQASFPKHKRAEALVMFRAEVLEYLIESVTATPQQLGDARKESADELEERHERVVSASLMALAMMLEVIAGAADDSGGTGCVEAQPPAATTAVSAAVPKAAALSSAAAAALAGMAEQLSALLAKAGFLKGVMGAKSPLVRRSAYMLIRSLAAKRPDVLSGQDVTGSVLGLFQEKDPANHVAMWDAVLTFVQARPTCWESVNLRKAVLPRLYAFLRHACYGSAQTSFPALLPLTSLLPAGALAPGPDVIAQLLDSVWAGWQEGSGRVAKSAAAEAYREVLLWALLNSPRLAVGPADSSTSCPAGKGAAGSTPSSTSAAATTAAYCQELLLERNGGGSSSGGSLLCNVLPAALGLVSTSERDVAVDLLGDLLARLVAAVAGRAAASSVAATAAALHEDGRPVAAESALVAEEPEAAEAEASSLEAAEATGADEQSPPLTQLCMTPALGPVLTTVMDELERALGRHVASAASAVMASGATSDQSEAKLQGITELLLRLRKRWAPASSSSTAVRPSGTCPYSGRTVQQAGAQPQPPASSAVGSTPDVPSETGSTTPLPSGTCPYSGRSAVQQDGSPSIATTSGKADSTCPYTGRTAPQAVRQLDASALAAAGLAVVAERLATAAVGAVLQGADEQQQQQQQQRASAGAPLLACLIREFGTVVMTGLPPLPGCPAGATSPHPSRQLDGAVTAATSPLPSRHHTSSFNLDSLVLSCLSGPPEGQQARAHADLLVSCLQASADSAAAWDSALTTIAGSSDALPDEDALELVVLLLQRLVATGLPAASSTAASSAEGWRCSALEKLAVRVASEAGGTATAADEVGHAASSPAASRLLSLVLGGNTAKVLLLQPAAVATVLQSLTAALAPAAAFAAPHSSVATSSSGSMPALDQIAAASVAVATMRELATAGASAVLWGSDVLTEAAATIVSLVFQISWASPVDTSAGRRDGLTASNHQAADDDGEASESSDTGSVFDDGVGAEVEPKEEDEGSDEDGDDGDLSAASSSASGSEVDSDGSSGGQAKRNAGGAEVGEGRGSSARRAAAAAAFAALATSAAALWDDGRLLAAPRATSPPHAYDRLVRALAQLLNARAATLLSIGASAAECGRGERRRRVQHAKAATAWAHHCQSLVEGAASGATAGGPASSHPATARRGAVTPAADTAQSVLSTLLDSAPAGGCPTWRYWSPHATADKCPAGPLSHGLASSNGAEGATPLSTEPPGTSTESQRSGQLLAALALAVSPTVLFAMDAGNVSPGSSRSWLLVELLCDAHRPITTAAAKGKAAAAAAAAAVAEAAVDRVLSGLLPRLGDAMPDAVLSEALDALATCCSISGASSSSSSSSSGAPATTSLIHRPADVYLASLSHLLRNIAGRAATADGAHLVQGAVWLLSSFAANWLRRSVPSSLSASEGGRSAVATPASGGGGGSSGGGGLPAAVLLEVLPVLAPVLRAAGGMELRVAGLEALSMAWLQRSLTREAVCVEPSEDSLQALSVVVACFPVPPERDGGTVASSSQQAAPVPLASEAERASLLTLLRHQAVRHAAAAATRRSAAAAAATVPPATTSTTGSTRTAGGEGGGADGGTENVAADPAEAASVTVAKLSLAAVTYCWGSLGSAEWRAVLHDARTHLSAACGQLTACTAALSGALRAAADEILATQGSSGTAALQILRRLAQRDVLKKHPAHVTLSDQVGAALAACRLTPAAAPAARLVATLLRMRADLQAQGATAAGGGGGAAGGAAATRAFFAEFATALGGSCEDVLRLVVCCGGVELLVQAAGVAAGGAGGALPSWRRNWSPLWSGAATAAERVTAWQPAAVAAATASADAELQAAGDTGVDAASALLAVVSSPQAHVLQAVSYQLLLGASLLERLTFSDLLAADDAPEYDAGGSAAEYLVTAGLRPELALVVAAGPAPQSKRVFFTAWSLLLARLMALPADTAGGRALRQALREVPGLIPALLDQVSLLLPLDQLAASRRGKKKAQPAAAAAATAAASSELAALAQAAAAGGSGAAANFSTAEALRACGLPCDSRSVKGTAVLLYRAVLRSLPASARTWFGDLRDRALAAAVEAYTEAVESPALLAAEMGVLQDKKLAAVYTSDQFNVRASPATREVVATMQIEDNTSLELAIRLAPATPLRAPEVECRRMLGVSETKLRKWLLSIAAFLRNQNQGVADAVLLWKRNLEKEFEGVEPCLICYNVISPTNSQLPRLECRTCHVKFHPACVYKWFKSSGKSQCPHCQSPW